MKNKLTQPSISGTNKSKENVQKQDVLIKKKMLEVTFAQIDKQYGSGAVMMLGQSGNSQIETISTGSILID